jgi:NAD(P)-dependent dehydrogenase (short-subunit alcohol dehydrogenase family)
MAVRFDGKVVWITGGGSGLGRALAEQMALQGARVVVSGRRVDRLDAVVHAVEKAGGEAAAVACDVTDEASISAAVAEIISRCGKLDIAVANAGFAVSGRVEQLDADDWRRQFETNVIGAALTAKHALAELKKTSGQVVLIGSVAGFICSPGHGAYTASKYAVRSIGQTLSAELHGSGVSCTTIHPGYVASEIAQVDNDGVFDGERIDKRPANLMWSAERAAKVMARAIAARKREFVFTGHGKIGAFIGQHMPSVAYLAMRQRH